MEQQNNGQNAAKRPAEPPKVSLVLKPQQEAPVDTTGEINLANVFSNMGKKKRIYFAIIAVFLIIGIFVPVIMFLTKGEVKEAKTLVTFTNASATSSIDYISSDYVVSNALKSVKLSKDVDASAVSHAISLQRVLTDDSSKMVEMYKKLIEKDEKYLEQLSALTLEYKNQYVVTLTNSFGKDNKKVVLTSGDLCRLLNAIMDSFETYYFETYANRELPRIALTDTEIQRYDYMESLERINASLNDLANFCKQKAGQYPLFRMDTNGRSFNDLVNEITEIKSRYTDYTYSYVYAFGLSKDSTTLVTNYQLQLRTKNLTLDEINKNIESGQKVIDEYEKNTIITQIQDKTSETSTFTTEYYNNLILTQQKLNEQKNNTQEEIKILEDKIERFSNGGGSSQSEKAEKEISLAYEACCSIFDTACELTNQLIASDSYIYCTIDATAAQTQKAGLSDYIKTFAIGPAAGLVLGLVVWFCDGFIVEFKRSNKKGEV